MKAVGQDIRALVPRGGVAQIAGELGVTPQAVSLALKAAKPNHPAVIAALKLAETSGSLAAAQQLAKLAPVAQAA